MRIATTILRLNPRLRYDPLELGHIGVQHRAELLGRAADDFRTGRVDPVTDLGQLQRLVDLQVELLDDRCRRTLRSAEA